MLKAGSVIDGKYRILSVIGRGGMSVVYLAMNEKANKFWAVKEIGKADCAKADLNRKEIEMMKKLRHPSIPSIVDVIEDGEALLIVMDYVEGLSLDAVLQERGALPQEKVLEWAKQLCRAFVYLHSRKPPVIYRDLKPANVIEKPDGSVVLIDFGAAREYKPRSLKDTVSLGTRGYAAPEQYEESGQSDARTDIYCLGVMLFQLLTGESPHRLRPLGECGSFFPAGLEEIILKCTQIQKEDRYQSCGELLYALEHLQEQDSAYRKKQKGRLRRFAACLGGALCFLLLSGILLGAEAGIRRHSYEAYLFSARNSVDAEEEMDNYEKAIRLNPFREEAWLGLLGECFLEDQLLTAQESSKLRQILIQYTGEGRTFETVFRKNEEGYARFAYEAGIAYFYKFEKRENKKIAKGYFESAAASEALEEPKRRRAERLALISGYYAEIGLADAAGDAFVSFRDYWDDLVELSAGNLAEEDNERTALVMYGEMTSQIAARAFEFRSAGVKRKEMLDQLAGIEEHLSSDFLNVNEEILGVVQKEIEELRRELRQAGRRVEAAFSQEEME